MAGEHILKLLADTTARVDHGDRWMCVNLILKSPFVHFYVYERKPYQKKTRTLIQTEDEEEACRILKEE